MMQASPCRHPPRLATWLVDLFASAEQAESILGDLAEEFSDIASTSGVLSARRWYWRESAKTIPPLFGASFRSAPWSLGSIVLAGFPLQWLGATLPERVIMAILRAQRPYSNLRYELYLWLINYDIPIACLVKSVLIGCLVAVLGEGREVVATLMFTVVWTAPFVSLVVLAYAHNADREPPFASVFHFFVFR